MNRACAPWPSGIVALAKEKGVEAKDLLLAVE